jgi:predicted nucleic acid-binding protein
MPNRIFVDTSFVIALINEDDQYHKPAQALSHEFEASPLITTDAVLLEIGNALAKDFRKQAVDVIKVFRSGSNTEVLDVDERLFEMGLEIFERYADKDWGLVDCISFAAMWDQGITEVLTFDGDFQQAGFTILKCRQ